MTSTLRQHPLLLFHLLTAKLLSSTNANTTTCERLTELTYTQSTAPSDVSAILALIHKKINSDVTNVMGINVEWGGNEIHRRVGERLVRSSVTRLTSVNGEEQTVTQCFEVPFTILDVDECTEVGEWGHACHETSVCVNTDGSYECVCPLLSGGMGAVLSNGQVADDKFWMELEQQSRTSWEVSYATSSQSSCPDQSSTFQCCDADGHSSEGARCRSNFHCPVDPCLHHKCASNAQCRRETPTSHPQYSCICPEGTMGNGMECMKRDPIVPKVKFDGVTATEETEMLLAKGLICGCAKPVIDVCSGVKCDGKHQVCTISSDNTPTCACKSGYIQHDHYGCVDENPPLLQIRPYPGHSSNDNSITRLTQGDRYEEHGVDIIDDNAEDYLRSLKIDYSRPVPQGCLLEMGQFDVNYTVATPWTTPNHARAQRTVVIGNVNECQIKRNVGVGKSCPELVAMCDVDAGAQCVDEIGTYSCKCPEGTEGDGFLPIAQLKPSHGGGYSGLTVPLNYRGGTGCRDTSRPVIEVLGPNPKTLRVAKVSRLEGDYKMKQSDDETSIKIDSLRGERRSYYENEIKNMIKASAGAELCATKARSNVRPSDCVRATDHAYNGVVDLSSRVIVGEPIADDSSPLQWRVPYNVADDAGNKAQTVWRDIVVEEVDLHEFEKKTRAAILAHRREEVEQAVKKAVDEERKRLSRSTGGKGDCPKCECNCHSQQGNSGGRGVPDCESVCEKKVAAALASLGDGANQVCKSESFTSISRHPWLLVVIDWTDELIGPDAMILLVFGCLIPIMFYLVWRIIYAFFFSSGSDVTTYYHSPEDEERERKLAQNVTYYQSPSARDSHTTQASVTTSSNGPPRPPTASLSTQRNGYFSPQEQSRLNGNTPQQQSNGQTQTYTSPFRTDDGTDSIYQTKSPITPLRNTHAPPARSYNLRNQR